MKQHYLIETACWDDEAQEALRRAKVAFNPFYIATLVPGPNIILTQKGRADLLNSTLVSDAIRRMKRADLNPLRMSVVHDDEKVLIYENMRNRLRVQPRSNLIRWLTSRLRSRPSLMRIALAADFLLSSR